MEEMSMAVSIDTTNHVKWNGLLHFSHKYQC